MIPICLVTGFLGSGKTTLLKQIVERNREQRILYLVNEFSPADIDGALVQETGADVVSLPGGSIFCKCLVSQFITQMRAIAERSTAEAPLDGVVVEASGMASPGVVAEMLKETKLDDAFHLAQVVVTVDPARFLKLRHTLPAVVEQVKAADRILLNKLDCCSAEEADETEAVIRELRPAAQVVRTEHCRVPFDLFPALPSERGLHGEYAKCRDPHYATIECHPEPDSNWAAWQTLVEQLRDDIYRIKGYAHLDDGASWLIEYAGHTLDRAPASADMTPNMVFIVRGEAQEAVRAALTDFPVQLL